MEVLLDILLREAQGASNTEKRNPPGFNQAVDRCFGYLKQADQIIRCQELVAEVVVCVGCHLLKGNVAGKLMTIENRRMFMGTLHYNKILVFYQTDLWKEGDEIGYPPHSCPWLVPGTEMTWVSTRSSEFDR